MHPISISAEKVFTLFGFLHVTNSLLTTWVVMALLITIGFFAGRRISDVPGRLQNAFEAIFGAFLSLFEMVMEDKHTARKVFCFVTTIFIFVMFSNWFELLPGVGAIGFYEKEKPAIEESVNTTENNIEKDNTVIPPAMETAPTAKTEVSPPEGTTPDAAHETAFVPLFRPGSSDLSFTLALAVCAMLYVQFMGIKKLRLGYFKKFIDLRNPIHFFVGILEIISEFAKVVSFSFRLFGNIFAGEVLLVVMTFLVPFIIPIPFYALEVFVGLVQALVFMMLTLVFVKWSIATQH